MTAVLDRKPRKRAFGVALTQSRAQYLNQQAACLRGCLRYRARRIVDTARTRLGAAFTRKTASNH
jgi:hypothetical protein